MKKGRVTCSKADKAGHESPGEDCWLPHQTVGVNRWFPVWLCPRQRHNKCSHCSHATASVSSYQQEIQHGFCRPGEGFWWSTSKGHQVGAEKETWCGFCDWCRGCMPVSRALSIFVRGTVKSLRWRFGVYEDSVLSLLLFIIVLEALPHVPLWGPLRGPLYQ